MTPDELRKKVGQIWGAESTKTLNEICETIVAAADAWEADRLAGHEWRIEAEAGRQQIEFDNDAIWRLQKRLEAAEKAWRDGNFDRLRAALAGEEK